ncbi:hypothetical protein [Labedella endophytica]|uniref:Large exoprotein n=1 Tax=Labedella endophytica TaxID=1523160 RepID=A0A3S0VS82_9MICO|nr:hypothetical protein [Labedella endophytica]RUQ99087.1 hypothetical protein ELQ94_12290 [Labedella endophytica]
MAGGGVLSGGVVFAIAAALWILYLIPTWRRRSEYIATERNAVRLQQTLRILAETSEVPEEVRVEASSRAVAEQQRVLKKHRAEQAAIAKAEAEALARKLKAESRKLSAEAAASALARSRRRARLATTTVLLASLVSTAFGGIQLATAGAWMLLAAGATGSVVCVGLLSRMARVTGRRSTAVAVAPVTAAAPASSALVEYEADVVPETTWTPVPLPRPLHLSQGTAAASAIAEAEAHERLRAAALAEAMAQRAAELARPVTTLPVRETPAASTAPAAPVAVEDAPAVDSRFARMGVIDETEIATNDIVRRRRMAG